MAFNVQTESHIQTEEARDIVIPLLMDWFKLDQFHKIGEDLQITRTASGGAAITITLVDLISPDAMKKLDEALAERGVKI